MPSGKEFVGKRLKPGIYMGTREVPGPGSYRHQFMAMIPKDPERFKGKLRDLGGGNLGIVVGGYVNAPVWKNLLGLARLTYHRNSPKDTTHLKKYLKGDPDEDVVLFRSANKGLPIDDTIEEVMARGRSYRSSEQRDHVGYPGLIRNILGRGKNSNTFIQTLAEQAGIRNRLRDAPGKDPGHDLRLSPERFQLKESSVQMSGFFDAYMGEGPEQSMEEVFNMDKMAFLDGYRKEAGWSEFRERLEGLVNDPLSAGWDMAKNKLSPRRIIRENVIDPVAQDAGRAARKELSTFMDEADARIGKMKADLDIPSQISEGITDADIGGQVQGGITGAGKDTWEQIKPYVYGAGGVAVALPLAIMGLSLADRISLHNKMKKLQELQKRETELEARQLELASGKR